MNDVMDAPETAEQRPPMFGKRSRLHAWSLGHPMRFGVAVAAMMALLFAISLGSWMLHHPVKGSLGAVTVGAIFGGTFAFGAHRANASS
jgi:hypothetical protein